MKKQTLSCRTSCRLIHPCTDTVLGAGRQAVVEFPLSKAAAMQEPLGTIFFNRFSSTVVVPPKVDDTTSKEDMAVPRKSVNAKHVGKYSRSKVTRPPIGSLPPMLPLKKKGGIIHVRACADHFIEVFCRRSITSSPPQSGRIFCWFP